MTSKEKAISVLYGIRADNLNLDDAYTKDKYDALTLAIKALEREPKSEWEHDHEILKAYSDGADEVLDKIRAEIEIEDLTYYGCEIHPRNVIDNILKIIDKYKAESEKE